ncbi:hypothetical protein CEXT_45141 [Caerostris extrusa]|uniref:Uncharacterized protein n=1 Tax=Caerostris extrusa TaxID=172846 RepID=A0AAV4URT7_CAEEX|nr:hypothetical protein CEXT_45141 [Caerostris extrusa]
MATDNQCIVEDTGPFEIAPCSRQMFWWGRQIHSKRSEMTLEVFLEEYNLKTADPLSSANTESIRALGWWSTKRIVSNVPTKAKHLKPGFEACGTKGQSAD